MFNCLHVALHRLKREPSVLDALQRGERWIAQTPWKLCDGIVHTPLSQRYAHGACEGSEQAWTSFQEIWLCVDEINENNGYDVNKPSGEEHEDEQHDSQIEEEAEQPRKRIRPTHAPGYEPTVLNAYIPPRA